MGDRWKRGGVEKDKAKTGGTYGCRVFGCVGRDV